ncbi:TonB-dependent receptor [Olleya aquimaris]|uniref:TonB-dependent receptor n=1 Tax=Olleya sediminilitoris TaxID=2795739 RepID=A0ABS1WN23_9FLAO|nr:TonB-dependent receptor [Olleya sediminilitoris]AXO81012.1 TonB-dependent receptor [Olleya aquimaris]MBL7560522.1 TonB-dependent receptor [Olleya sediminilitoris]
MKNLFLFLTFLMLSICASAQQQSTQLDTTKVTKLDEVLIQSIRVKDDAPITHSNVTKANLESRNLGQDIPILLNYLPSVVTTSDAGAGVGYTGIRVRGVSAQSTNITINGIPYNDSESLGTFWVNLGDFTSSVESLQLQRGVGTSTNGSGAFGASINVLSDAVSKKASGEVSNSFGSYNTRKHTVKYSTGLLNNQIEISGRLSQINSDGYIDRATSDLKSYFLQGAYIDDNTLIKAITFGGKEVTYQSWNGFDPDYVSALGANPNIEENRTFNVSGAYFDQDGNLQFYDNEVDNYQQDHYQLHWNQKINNYWSTNLGLNYTKGSGYFEQYKEDEDFETYGFDELVIGGETIDQTDVIRRRWLDNDFYVLNANVNYTDDKLNLSSGLFYSSYHGDHFGEVIWSQYASNSQIRDHYYDSDGDKYDFSTFAKANYQLNSKLSLFVDLQFRSVNYDTSGINSDLELFVIDKTYNFFNPKAGVSYNLNNNNNFYLSYARANREASRSDFESNPNIKPEQLNDFELGWRYKNQNLVFNANAYYMLYNEQLVLTGALDDVGAPIRENSGKSSRLGLELEAVVKVNDQFSIQPNVTLSSNKNDETIISKDGSLVNLGKTNISFSPDIVASNAIVFKPINALQLSFLSKYIGEQYMSNTDSQASKLDSYFVNDFNVSYEIKTNKIFKSILLSGLINNVFGEEYISNGYYYTYDDTWSDPNTTTTIEGTGYYPQATTNFLVGATLKF